MTTLATALADEPRRPLGRVRDEARTDLDPERFAPPDRAARPRGTTGPGSPSRCRPLAGDRPRRARLPDGRWAATATSAARSPRSRCSATPTCRCMVKAGVQWGLFGGAVANLGTERHHTAYLPVDHRRDAARAASR